MRRRIQIGQHVRVLGEATDGLELEGAARLRPGQMIDVVLDPARAAGTEGRPACVMSWYVARLGKDGPIYQGLCRWQ